MADMTTMEQAQQVMGALGYPTLALPQSIQPVTNTKATIQRTQYDPTKWQALMTALSRPTVRKSPYESLAQALAQAPQAQTFKGAYGVDVMNPWAVGASALARGFGSVYGDRLAAQREAEEKDRENAIKAAQLDAEATKQAVTRETSTEHMKVNDPNAGGNVAYRFTPERINKMKELNEQAGRWATEYGKGVSDMMNTEASQAYNEFEGLAKQYVQDQLKKIYGAQMTEQEGERFFKSMGLSPYLDPALRWRLVENALNDVAQKNNIDMQQLVAPNQTPIAKNDDGSFTVNGYTIRVKK